MSFSTFSSVLSFLLAHEALVTARVNNLSRVHTDADPSTVPFRFGWDYMD